jgi:hypothetical protein
MLRIDSQASSSNNYVEIDDVRTPHLFESEGRPTL